MSKPVSKDQRVQLSGHAEFLMGSFEEVSTTTLFEMIMAAAVVLMKRDPKYVPLLLRLKNRK